MALQLVIDIGDEAEHAARQLDPAAELVVRLVRTEWALEDAQREIATLREALAEAKNNAEKSR